MKVEDAGGVQIDVCPECAGIWFDDGELRTLLKESPGTLQALDDLHVPELEVLTSTGSYRHCPRDNDVLETYQYAYDTPIKIDSCPTCHGVFVEDQELAAIHAAVDSAGRARVTAALRSRSVIAGRPSSAEKPEETVSGLIQALHHWREHQNA
jgi:Zn-finger nucleic acid-binding protein